MIPGARSPGRRVDTLGLALLGLPTSQWVVGTHMGRVRMEIGYVGSAMLFAYAIGKIVNGFIADRVNVKKYIMLGLFVSALANLLVGFHIPALMLAVVLTLAAGCRARR